jgi:hypothetical protein
LATTPRELLAGYTSWIAPRHHLPVLAVLLSQASVPLRLEKSWILIHNAISAFLPLEMKRKKEEAGH